MNPRQRRGVLYLLTAALVAVGVLVGVTRYVADVSSQVGNRITVYRAAAPIAPYVPLSASNLEPVEVPERWTSSTSRLSLDDLDGRRVGFPLEPGTVLTSDMLIPPSELDPAEREIAINVDPVTGVAGRVRPGDFVDIYAVFADVPGLAPQVRVLVRDVRVITIGGTQVVRETDSEGALTQDAVVPVTLALSPNDALSVTYAAAFAQEVRLVALPTDTELDRSVETDDFDAENLGGVAVPAEAGR